MTNLFKMMKDAVAAQHNLKKIQEELKRKTVDYATPDGKVRVTACGDASLLGIKIDAAIMAPGRTAELEKALLTAVNGALEEAKKMSAAHMQGLMAKMGLPNIPGL